MFKFIRAYVKSMRLYYSFITGVAGWIGVAYYEFLAHSSVERTIEVVPPIEKKIVILVLLFLSWGINQIINDYLGIKEDRINAPQRPMVTGELNSRLALGVSIGLLIMTGFVTWFYLEPKAVIFLIAGVLLNVLYQHAKGYGILGNITFGLMITMATLFGGFASGPTHSSIYPSHRFATLILIFILNALMTFYTYFKDYRGDKQSGKKTLVVHFGLRRSRFLALFLALLPTIVFFALKESGLLRVHLNTAFIILGSLTVFLQLWTGILYFLNPVGKKNYTSLKINFRACACGQASLIALFNPDLAIWLFIFSYVFVDFLFDFHKNAKA